MRLDVPELSFEYERADPSAKRTVGMTHVGFKRVYGSRVFRAGIPFEILIEADRLTRIDITMKAAQHPCSKGEAQESAWPFQGRKAP